MHLCRDQYRNNGEVKLKSAYSLPPNERTMNKVKMSEAVPHLQSWVNEKHSRHFTMVLINKLNYLAILSQTNILRQSRNPYLTDFLNDSFLNQGRY